MRILVATCAGVSPEAGIAGIPLTKIAGHFALPLFAGSVASQTEGITEVAPTPLPETPTPGATDVTKGKKKAEVTTGKTSKKTTSKGTAGLATEKAEGTGLQGTGTQQGLNLGTIAEAKTGSPQKGPKKKTGGNY